jgi:hypothetical protein
MIESVWPYFLAVFYVLAGYAIVFLFALLLTKA